MHLYKTSLNTYMIEIIFYYFLSIAIVSNLIFYVFLLLMAIRREQVKFCHITDISILIGILLYDWYLKHGHM